MKKKITNQEIEGFITTIGKDDSFFKTCKMPIEMRQALRLNVNCLRERLQVYNESRSDIVKTYINNGYAVEGEDGRITFDEKYIPSVNEELKELAMYENEMNFELISHSVLEVFLKTHDLSMAEEEVLLFFDKPE